MNDWRPDPVEVLDFYGVCVRGTTGWQKILCPLVSHDDKSPSASVNIESGKYQCFGCGSFGDMLDVIQENEPDVDDFPGSLQFAKERFGGGDSAVSGQSRHGGGLLPPRKRAHSGGRHFVPAWKGF